MIRPAVSGRRIAMSRHDHFGVHRGCSNERIVKVVDFEPEQDAIAVRLVIRVADREVMMLDLKVVQLHHEHAVEL